MNKAIWNWRLSWTALVFVIVLVSPEVARANCADYSEYLHLRGRANVFGYTMKVAGNYAYVGGSKLYVVDISNPDAPTVADSIDVSGFVWKITLDANYAYLAEGTSGFQIVDITEPTSVSVVSTVDADSLGYANAVVVVDQLAYVAASAQLQPGFLHIFNISNPASPTHIKSVLVPHFPQNVDVAGNYAYVTTGSTLEVVDIQDAASASVVGSVFISSAVRAITLRGDYAYVGNIQGISGTGDGLYIVDISNPTAPAVIDTVRVQDYEVALGTDLYLVNSSGLHAFDITNPAAPEHLGSIGFYDGGGSVAASGNFAYATTGAGFQVIDVSKPTNLPPVGMTNLCGEYGWEVAVTGSLACVATDSCLSLVDVSNPLAPFQVGKVPTRCYDVAVNGNLAYAINPGGLTVVDLTMPSVPSVIGALSINGGRIALSGSLACITINDSLRVINVSNPASPASVGTVAVPTSYDVSALGDYACLAAGDSGLKVVDISVPSSPVVVGSLELPVTYLVTMAGNFAYVAGDRVQFGVVDLSTPTSPILVGTTRLAVGVVNDLVVDGSYAYVVDTLGGLQVVDVSIPSNPRVVGSTLTPLRTGGTRAITVAGSFVYVAGGVIDDGHADFWIAPTQCSASVPVVLSGFDATATTDGIAVRWSTVQDLEYSGFHVHRAAHVEGPYMRLTSQAIVPPGPYAFLDRQVANGGTYFYKLEAVDRGGKNSFFGPVSARAGGFHINLLSRSHPNPFRGPLVSIDFDLTTRGPTKLTILDVAGRRVRLLVNEVRESGHHRITWDGLNDRGESVPTGLYFYRLEEGSFSETRSLVRLK